MKVSNFVFNTFSSYLKEPVFFEKSVIEIGNLKNLPSEIYDLMLPSRYVPASVVKLDKITTCFKITFKVKETDVVIYLGQVGKTRPPFNRVIKLSRLYVYMLDHLKHLPLVTLIILPFNQKKLLPKPKQVIDTEHVNTGLMSRSLSGAQILLYRTEELGKVLLHELMHLYHMDFNDMAHDKEIELKLRALNINIQPNKRLAVHEVYNDTMTLLFMIGIEILLRPGEPPKTLAAFTKLYKKELVRCSRHVYESAAKILAHYGKKSLFDANPIQEESHAFCYFIGKAVTFATLDSFLDTVPSNFLLNSSPDLYKAFTGYFVQAVQMKQVSAKLNEAFRRLQKQPNKSFMKSGRMSYFDL